MATAIDAHQLHKIFLLQDHLVNLQAQIMRLYLDSYLPRLFMLLLLMNLNQSFIRLVLTRLVCLTQLAAILMKFVQLVEIQKFM